ncbi:MAG: MucB/RseB C-terminal domain-containing protein [Aquisalimonadaceae bacterium]
MIRWLPRILLGSLTLSTALFAAGGGQDDPRYWLQRMVDAARSVSFSGDLVYVQGPQLDALHIVRLHDGGEQHERLYSLSGPDREILRDGRQVTRIFPADQAVMVDQSEGRRRLTDLTSDQITHLESWYSVSLDGEDRIADRPAVRVEIEPRDEHRYGYKLWLDRDSGLLLRSQMKSLDGDVLEQFMYVEIRFNEIDRKAVASSVNHEGFRYLGVESETRPPRSGEWTANDLPAGFRLLSEGWWRMPGVKDIVRHQMYGDGLGSVSVYIASDIGKPFHGQSSHGAMHVVGHVIDDHQVTVVGDVPLGTVKRILKGLEYRH